MQIWPLAVLMRAFQDEVAASEGFLKQPVGKDYIFAGPSVKNDQFFGVGTGMGCAKPMLS